jgi:hypothetical protein
MQETQDRRYNSFTFTIMEGEPNQDGGQDKSFQEEGQIYTKDVPLEMYSMPTKLQDGNPTLQCEVSPLPGYANNTTAPATSDTMGSSGYFISPMPPTPSTAADTPPSHLSKDTHTLAALYHSSRRSRRDSPMPTPPYANAQSSRHGFPLPPLASASPKQPEPSSFHSTAKSSTSNHENWSTSVDSMTGFIQAPPLYNSNQDLPCSSNPPCTDVQIQATQVFNAPAPATFESYLTPLIPAKPTISSMSQFEFTPTTTMDRQLLDLANESSANICMEQFSKLRSRSFEGQYEGATPQSTKRQKTEEALLFHHFEQTPHACKPSAGVIAYPAPEISPLNDGVQDSIQSLLALSRNEGAVLCENQNKGAAQTNTKDQDIIRRKVQRLLLIRHATRCNAPTHSTESKVDGSVEYVCPVTSHCAEGKRLASHIRTCRDTNCQYKWCLTTRDVLGHYRNCRERKCQVCGPVRAMHRRDEQKGKEKERETGALEEEKYL